MKQDSLKKNFIFQLFYNIITLVLPLIISPIITRRLGSTALGTYVYIGSVAYYFVMFANLGISKYGQRIIASRKNDNIQLRKTFWSLYFVHTLFSLVSLSAYIIFILFFVKDNLTIYWLYIIYVSSAIFDITWLFYGFENFKNVVIKNLVCKVVVFALIIVFVKTPNDLPAYTLIELLALLVANIVLFPTAIKSVKLIKFSKADCIEHIKPMLILFISVVASSLYTVFDKMLLGILSSKDDVAYYEYANKIIAIPRTFVTIIGSVLFPKACALASKNDFKGRNKYAGYSYLGLAIIAFASIFGLIAIGPQLVTLYYGAGFSACGNIVVSLTPLIFIIGLGEIVRSVFLIPQKRDLFYIICLCLNALINIGLTFWLIPIIGIYGAVIGTTAAELFGLIAQCFYCRKFINFKSLFKSTLIFAFIGVTMLLIIKGTSRLFNEESIKSLIILFFIGAVTYLFLSLLAIKLFYKDVWDNTINWLKNKTNRKLLE